MMHSSSPKLHVMMLGLRGFPDVQGGIEKHAERLCPLLVRMGCDMEVIVRARHTPAGREGRWQGVRFLRLWSPKSPSLETLIHTLIGVLIAAWKRPHILHIHAVGPAALIPLARLLGLRVVVTHHGCDYEREKWGTLGKLILRAGEACGMLLAHERIAVSQVVTDMMRRKYDVDCKFIPNGIDLPKLPTTTSALTKFRLSPRKYVLMVGRLVPEKRQADLIAAFGKARLEGWKLALVGGSDHQTRYADTVTGLAAENADVIMTGVQTGIALQELYAHAGLFVLPSSHEGLPIALMEALSFGLPVIASNIPANLEIGLASRHYFPVANVNALSERLREFAAMPWSSAASQDTRNSVAAKQNWHSVAEDTLNSYSKAAKAGRRIVAHHVAAPGFRRPAADRPLSRSKPD